MNPTVRTSGVTAHLTESAATVTDASTGAVIQLEGIAAQLWRSADGTRSFAELRELCGRRLGRPVAAAEMWTALDVLGDGGLLTERVAPPAGDARLDRRSLLHRVGLVGGAAVAVSVLGPAAALAKTDPAKDNAGGLPACQAQELGSKSQVTVQAEEIQRLRTENAQLSQQEQSAKSGEAQAKAGESDCRTAASQEQEEKARPSEHATKQSQERDHKVAEAAAEQQAKAVPTP